MFYIDTKVVTRKFLTSFSGFFLVMLVLTAVASVVLCNETQAQEVAGFMARLGL